MEESELVDEIKYWHAETQRLRAGTQTLVAHHDEQNERLRAENAATQEASAIVANTNKLLHAELDWFRRIDQFLEKIGNPETSFVETVRVQTALQEWLEANPKPGAGT